MIVLYIILGLAGASILAVVLLGSLEDYLTWRDRHEP